MLREAQGHFCTSGESEIRGVWLGPKSVRTRWKLATGWRTQNQFFLSFLYGTRLHPVRHPLETCKNIQVFICFNCKSKRWHPVAPGRHPPEMCKCSIFLYVSTQSPLPPHLLYIILIKGGVREKGPPWGVAAGTRVWMRLLALMLLEF